MMRVRSRVGLAVACVLMLAGPLADRGVAQATESDIDPKIAAISEQRMHQLLEKLTSFGTRNTLSEVESPTHGIGAARQWILDELKRTSPKLQVSFDTHQIPQGGRITRPVELRNVLAILPGRSPRRIYVSAHYDTVNLGQRGQLAGNSRSGSATARAMPAPGAPPDPNAPPPDYNIPAPGANDDGSGIVLMMELARVFAESGLQFDATIVFTAFAGEEQGLVGAIAHAKQAAADKIPIDADFNNDIVGGAVGGNGLIDSKSVKVYSEGPEDSASRAIARFVVRQAARYVPSHRVRPMARVDRFGRGGDHTGFNQNGYPAICFRESSENFAKQHDADDTIDGVSFPYLLQNARVNAAGVAVMALAPPAPAVTNDRGAPFIGRQPSGYDASLRWNASPGAAAYRIFWRDAWAQDWQHEMTVGNVTEYVLPNMSIDDYVFGIAALDAAGHESVIAAYVTPRRAF
jgi:hypothetical protein